MTFKARLFKSYWFQNLLFFFQWPESDSFEVNGKSPTLKKSPPEQDVAVQNKQVETMVRAPTHIICILSQCVYICVYIDSYIHSHVQT